MNKYTLYVITYLFVITSYGQIRGVKSVFPIDTSGVSNGRAVAPSIYNSLFISGDTIYFDADLYYLAKLTNFQGNLDSISNFMTDTILYRTQSIRFYDTIQHVFIDTMIQKIGFFWTNDVVFDEGDINYTNDYIGDGTCQYANYTDNGEYLCHTIETCNLSNNQTTEWCSEYSYTKVFEDNFDGDKLDEKLWKIGYGGGATQISATDLGLVLHKNAVVSNGTLKLITKYEGSPLIDDASTGFASYACCDYSVGAIGSNAQFGYGKFEIRAKIPTIAGVNPAYWLIGPDMEIDGFEFFYYNKGDWPTMSVYSNRNNTINNLPSGCASNANSKVRLWQVRGKQYSSVWNTPPFNVLQPLDNGQWHTFTLIYDPNYIKWIIDDYYSIRIDKRWQSNYIPAEPSGNCSCTGCFTQERSQYPDFNEKLNFILDNGIFNSKNHLTGTGEQNGPYTCCPSTFEIDYVRIYAKDNCQLTKNYPSGDFLAANDNANRNEITANDLTFGGTGPYIVHYMPWTGGSTSYEYPLNQILFARADNEIKLLDGFSIEQGAVFEGTIAYPGDCSDIFDSGTQTNKTANNSSHNESSSTFGSVRNESISNMKIFPNPANTEIFVSNLGDYTSIEVLGIGLVNIKTVPANKEKIDVSGLASGIYFLKVNYENKLVLFKFIKE